MHHVSFIYIYMLTPNRKITNNFINKTFNRIKFALQLKIHKKLDSSIHQLHGWPYCVHYCLDLVMHVSTHKFILCLVVHLPVIR